MSKVPMPELLANSLTLGQRASLDRWATAYGDARAAEARREALGSVVMLNPNWPHFAQMVDGLADGTYVLVQRALAQQAEQPALHPQPQVDRAAAEKPKPASVTPLNPAAAETP